jgi:hypothetical protein
MQRFSQYLFSTAFFITCIHFAFDTEAVEQKNGTSMQLPSWVESIGEPSKSQSDGTAPEEAIVPVVQSAVKSKNPSNPYSKKQTLLHKLHKSKFRDQRLRAKVNQVSQIVLLDSLTRKF